MTPNGPMPNSCSPLCGSARKQQLSLWKSTIGGMDHFANLALSSCPPLSSVMARAGCIHEAGTFNEEVYRSQDRDLWLRVALRNRAGFVPDVLLTPIWNKAGVWSICGQALLGLSLAARLGGQRVGSVYGSLV